MKTTRGDDALDRPDPPWAPMSRKTTLQAPIVARHRDEPRGARLTMSAWGKPGGGKVSRLVETARAPVEAGLHPATGGPGVGCPAEGDLLFRGELAVARDPPVGFTSTRLRFALDTDARPDEVETLVAPTERNCVVLQTLRSSPRLTTTVTTG
jgi:hypothetical protein